MKKLKNGWVRKSSKIAHENPWYKVQKDLVVFPDSSEGEYYTVKTGASSFVIAVRNECVVFVRQYRYVFDEWFLELPGGGVEDDPAKTAAQELQEEVGLRAEKLKKIGTFIPLSGILDEVSHVYIAENISEVGQSLESSEKGTEVVDIPILEAYKMIDKGGIVDGQTITCLMLAKNHLCKKGALR